MAKKKSSKKSTGYSFLGGYTAPKKTTTKKATTTKKTSTTTKKVTTAAKAVQTAVQKVTKPQTTAKAVSDAAKVATTVAKSTPAVQQAANVAKAVTKAATKNVSKASAQKNPTSKAAKVVIANPSKGKSNGFLAGEKYAIASKKEIEKLPVNMRNSDAVYAELMRQEEERKTQTKERTNKRLREQSPIYLSNNQNSFKNLWEIATKKEAELTIKKFDKMSEERRAQTTLDMINKNLPKNYQVDYHDLYALVKSRDIFDNKSILDMVQGEENLRKANRNANLYLKQTRLRSNKDKLSSGLTDIIQNGGKVDNAVSAWFTPKERTARTPYAGQYATETYSYDKNTKKLTVNQRTVAPDNRFYKFITNETGILNPYAEDRELGYNPVRGVIDPFYNAVTLAGIAGNGIYHSKDYRAVNAAKGMTLMRMLGLTKLNDNEHMEYIIDASGAAICIRYTDNGYGNIDLGSMTMYQVRASELECIRTLHGKNKSIATTRSIKQFYAHLMNTQVSNGGNIPIGALTNQAALNNADESIYDNLAPDVREQMQELFKSISPEILQSNELWAIEDAIKTKAEQDPKFRAQLNYVNTNLNANLNFALSLLIMAGSLLDTPGAAMRGLVQGTTAVKADKKGNAVIKNDFNVRTATPSERRSHAKKVLKSTWASMTYSKDNSFTAIFEDMNKVQKGRITHPLLYGAGLDMILDPTFFLPVGGSLSNASTRLATDLSIKTGGLKAILKGDTSVHFNNVLNSLFDGKLALGVHDFKDTAVDKLISNKKYSEISEMLPDILNANNKRLRNITLSAKDAKEFKERVKLVMSAYLSDSGLIKLETYLDDANVSARLFTQYELARKSYQNADSLAKFLNRLNDVYTGASLNMAYSGVYKFREAVRVLKKEKAYKYTTDVIEEDVRLVKSLKELGGHKLGEDQDPLALLKELQHAHALKDDPLQNIPEALKNLNKVGEETTISHIITDSCNELVEIFNKQEEGWLTDMFNVIVRKFPDTTVSSSHHVEDALEAMIKQYSDALSYLTDKDVIAQTQNSIRMLSEMYSQINNKCKVIRIEEAYSTLMQYSYVNLAGTKIHYAAEELNKLSTTLLSDKDTYATAMQHLGNAMYTLDRVAERTGSKELQHMANWLGNVNKETSLKDIADFVADLEGAAQKLGVVQFLDYASDVEHLLEPFNIQEFKNIREALKLAKTNEAQEQIFNELLEEMFDYVENHNFRARPLKRYTEYTSKAEQATKYLMDSLGLIQESNKFNEPVIKSASQIVREQKANKLVSDLATEFEGIFKELNIEADYKPDPSKPIYSTLNTSAHNFIKESIDVNSEFTTLMSEVYKEWGRTQADAPFSTYVAKLYLEDSSDVFPNFQERFIEALRSEINYFGIEDTGKFIYDEVLLKLHTIATQYKESTMNRHLDSVVTSLSEAKIYQTHMNKNVAQDFMANTEFGKRIQEAIYTPRFSELGTVLDAIRYAKAEHHPLTTVEENLLEFIDTAKATFQLYHDMQAYLNKADAYVKSASWRNIINDSFLNFTKNSKDSLFSKASDFLAHVKEQIQIANGNSLSLDSVRNEVLLENGDVWQKSKAAGADLAFLKELCADGHEADIDAALSCYTWYIKDKNSWIKEFSYRRGTAPEKAFAFFDTETQSLHANNTSVTTAGIYFYQGIPRELADDPKAVLESIKNSLEENRRLIVRKENCAKEDIHDFFGEYYLRSRVGENSTLDEQYDWLVKNGRIVDNVEDVTHDQQMFSNMFNEVEAFEEKLGIPIECYGWNNMRFDDKVLSRADSWEIFKEKHHVQDGQMIIRKNQNLILSESQEYEILQLYHSYIDNAYEAGVTELRAVEISNLKNKWRNVMHELNRENDLLARQTSIRGTDAVSTVAREIQATNPDTVYLLEELNKMYNNTINFGMESKAIQDRQTREILYEQLTTLGDKTIWRNQALELTPETLRSNPDYNFMLQYTSDFANKTPEEQVKYIQDVYNTELYPELRAQLYAYRPWATMSLSYNHFHPDEPINFIADGFKFTAETRSLLEAHCGGQVNNIMRFLNGPGASNIGVTIFAEPQLLKTYFSEDFLQHAIEERQLNKIQHLSKHLDRLSIRNMRIPHEQHIARRNEYIHIINTLKKHDWIDAEGIRYWTKDILNAIEPERLDSSALAAIAQSLTLYVIEPLLKESMDPIKHLDQFFTGLLAIKTLNQNLNPEFFKITREQQEAFRKAGVKEAKNVFYNLDRQTQKDWLKAVMHLQNNAYADEIIGQILKYVDSLKDMDDLFSYENILRHMKESFNVSDKTVEAMLNESILTQDLDEKSFKHFVNTLLNKSYVDEKDFGSPLKTFYFAKAGDPKESLRNADLPLYLLNSDNLSDFTKEDKKVLISLFYEQYAPSTYHVNHEGLWKIIEESPERARAVLEEDFEDVRRNAQLLEDYYEHTKQYASQETPYYVMKMVQQPNHNIMQYISDILKRIEETTEGTREWAEAKLKVQKFFEAEKSLNTSALAHRTNFVLDGIAQDEDFLIKYMAGKDCPMNALFIQAKDDEALMAVVDSARKNPHIAVTENFGTNGDTYVLELIEDDELSCTKGFWKYKGKHLETTQVPDFNWYPAISRLDLETDIKQELGKLYQGAYTIKSFSGDISSGMARLEDFQEIYKQLKAFAPNVKRYDMLDTFQNIQNASYNRNMFLSTYPGTMNIPGLQYAPDVQNIKDTMRSVNYYSSHIMDAESYKVMWINSQDVMGVTHLWEDLSDEDCIRVANQPGFVVAAMVDDPTNIKRIDRLTELLRTETDAEQRAKYMSEMSLRSRTQVQFLDISNAEDIANAKRLHACIIPQSVAETMAEEVNYFTPVNPVAKAWQKYVITMKTSYLAKLGTAMRNYLDETLKTIQDVGWENAPQTVRAQFRAVADLSEYHQIITDIKRFSGEASLDKSQVKKLYYTYKANNSLPKSAAWERMEFNRFNQVHNFMMTAASGSGNAGEIRKMMLKNAIGDPNLDLEGGFLSAVPKAIGAGASATDIGKYAWDSTVSLSLLPMGLSETISRYAHYSLMGEMGIAPYEVYARLSDTHFNYALKDRATVYTELLMPFYNFQKLNLDYWTRQFMINPKTIGDYLRIERVWGNEQVSHASERQEQYDVIDNPYSRANSLRMEQLINGSIPLPNYWGTVEGQWGYLKLNPSMYDAFAFFSQPLNKLVGTMFSPLAELFSKIPGISDLAAQGIWEGTYGSGLSMLVPYYGSLIKPTQQTVASYFKKLGLEDERTALHDFVAGYWTTSIATVDPIWNAELDYDQLKAILFDRGYSYDTVRKKFMRTEYCIATNMEDALMWWGDRGYQYNYLTGQYVWIGLGTNTADRLAKLHNDLIKDMTPEEARAYLEKGIPFKQPEDYAKYNLPSIFTWDNIREQNRRFKNKDWDYVSGSFVSLDTPGAIFDYNQYTKSMESKGYAWDYITRRYLLKNDPNIATTWQEAAEYFRTHGNLVYDYVRKQYVRPDEALAKSWKEKVAYYESKGMVYDEYRGAYVPAQYAIQPGKETSKNYKGYSRYGKSDRGYYKNRFKTWDEMVAFQKSRGLGWNPITKKWVALKDVPSWTQYQDYKRSQGLGWDAINKTWVPLENVPTWNQYQKYMESKGLEWDYIDKKWVPQGTAKGKTWQDYKNHTNLHNVQYDYTKKKYVGHSTKSSINKRVAAKIFKARPDYNYQTGKQSYVYSAIHQYLTKDNPYAGVSIRTMPATLNRLQVAPGRTHLNAKIKTARFFSNPGDYQKYYKDVRYTRS